MSALKPDTANTHDLGTSSLPWKALHVDEIALGARAGVTGNKLVIGTEARLNADANDKVSVQIYGDLSVFGSQTTISSTTLEIKDLNITVAKDAADSAAANGAGLFVDGASASLLYSHDPSQWELNKPLEVTGNVLPQATATYDLGSTTLGWNDLHLDAEGVINFDAGNMTVTHSAELLAIAGGPTRVAKLEIDSASDHIDVNTDMTLTASAGITLDAVADIVLDADGDDITFKAGADDSTGLKWSQSNSGDWTNLVGTQDKDLIFQVNDGGAATEVMRLDGDVSSLLMAGTKKITFGDAGSFVHQSSNGKLAISSDGAAADAVVVTSSNAAGGIDIDAGTGGITIDSTGAFSVDGAAASNITVTTDADAEDLTISVAGATNSSLILSSSGTAADALSISTSAGGIDITVAGAAAGEDLDLTSNTSINITGAEDADDAVVISGSNGGVTIDAGGNSPVEINASGAAINIGNDDANGNINIGGDGDRTINIGVDSHANTIDLSAQTLTLDAGSSGFTMDGAAASSVSTSGGALTVNGKTGLNLQEDGTNVIAIDTNRDVLFSQTGGSTGDPDVQFDGYVKFDGSSEFDGAVQVDGNLTANNPVSVQNTLTVGANGGSGGYDVQFFGETNNQYLKWDHATDELVLAGDSKLSFHDAAGGENIIASADGHLEVNAGTTLDMTAPTVDINASTAVTVESATFTLGSVDVATDLNPTLTIQRTGNNTGGGTLKFIKDKGAAGASGDDAGVISFFADNAAQEQTEFARVTAEVQTATDGQEGGKLSLSVAEHDGTMTAGLVLTEGSTDGVIDVSIGAGTGSTTTIAGNLTVNGTTTTVNSTTVQVDDKNIELGVGSADDAAADGGGITLKSGDGDKTFNWVNATSSWTSSEDLDLVNGKHLSIAGTTVLTADGVAKVQSGVAGAGLSHANGVLALDIDELNALGGTGIAQADHFVFSDGGTEKKITFSNLEDAIFGNVSGDATVAAGGVLTIAAGAVHHGMLAEDIISGQTELAHANIQDADELIISDTDNTNDGNGTTEAKRVGVDSLRDHYFGAISGDIAVADGGAATIQANAVEGSMLNNNVVSGQTEHTGVIDDTDEFLISDNGAIKRTDFSVLRDAVFADVSGDATVAAGGGLTIAAGAVANTMLANDHITVAGDSGSQDIHLNDTLTISGTAGEIETSVSGDTITIGLPDNVDVDGTLTVASSSNLNGSVIVDTNGGATFRLRDVDGGSNKFVVAANGDTTISGKLTVSGVLESDGTNLEVKDALVQIGSTGVGAFVDTGIYSTLSANENLGLIWDRSAARFKLYESLDDPDSEEFTFSTGSASTLELGQIHLNDSAEDAGDAQATPLTTHATYYVTAAAEESSLAAGTEGQIKVLAMKSNGGNATNTMTVTVAENAAAWGGNRRIILTDNGDACTLQFIDSQWYCIGNNGCTFN